MKGRLILQMTDMSRQGDNDDSQEIISLDHEETKTI